MGTVLLLDEGQFRRRLFLVALAKHPALGYRPSGHGSLVNGSAGDAMWESQQLGTSAV
jgi:hypothetical protein